VSKRLGSLYRSGRCKDWLKFKNSAAPAVKRKGGLDREQLVGRDRGTPPGGVLVVIVLTQSSQQRDVGPPPPTNYRRSDDHPDPLGSFQLAPQCGRPKNSTPGTEPCGAKAEPLGRSTRLMGLERVRAASPIPPKPPAV
jgi:hypothetical protein